MELLLGSRRSWCFGTRTGWRSNHVGTIGLEDGRTWALCINIQIIKTFLCFISNCIIFYFIPTSPERVWTAIDTNGATWAFTGRFYFPHGVTCFRNVVPSKFQRIRTSFTRNNIDFEKCKSLRMCRRCVNTS